ncbi:MAG: hypothetical protein ACP5E8_06600 [Thermoplasmata archaeon]
MGYGLNRKRESKNGKAHNRIGKGMTRLRPVQSFHLKLKHLLAGVSFLSLFAAFEVFSIPAANGIILLLNMNRIEAGEVWIAVALVSGGIAIVLHKEEKR